MKKNDWILLVSVALYSWLFYRQTLGINCLLFTTALIAATLVKDKTIWKNRPWQASVLGSVLSSCAVLYYGNALSFTATCISLLALAAFSIQANSSFLVSLITSVYSSLSSVIFMFLDWAERQKHTEHASDKKPFHVKFLMIFLPLSVVVLFFALYRGANPLFYQLTEKIDLSFISISWIGFTTTGLLLMYGFFRQQSIPFLYNYDKNAPNTIYAELTPGKRWLGISAIHEWGSGVILLSLLNILLLVVNSLDLVYMWLSTSLPPGMTYSEFVHQGTGLLITSIMIAISIILFYFRGDLNFYRNSKALKILAAIWIIQNIFMIASTAFRNQLYIDVYSLTYKRIGVYVYLLLACIGLISTFVKIQRVKSNWFLFRVNGWLFYAVLVLCTPVNWDYMITRFNINQSVRHGTVLDQDYLLSLSPASLPELVMHENKFPKDCLLKNNLSEKVNEFLVSEKNKDWQSYSIENRKIFYELNKKK